MGEPRKQWSRCRLWLVMWEVQRQLVLVLDRIGMEMGMILIGLKMVGEGLVLTCLEKWRCRGELRRGSLFKVGIVRMIGRLVREEFMNV